MRIYLRTILLLIALACLTECAASAAGWSAADKGSTKKATLLGTLRNFAMGNGMLKTLYSISFDPHAGETARRYYQAAHGYRGQALIDRVGMGYSRNQLRRFGAVD